MNMKPIRKLLLSALFVLALCLVVFSGCSEQEKTVPDGMQIASVSGDRFLFFVPTSWNLNTGSGVASAYYLTSAMSSVSVREIRSDAADAEAFRLACMEEYRAKFGEHLIEDRTDSATLGGIEGKIWTFTAWDKQENGEDLQYRVLQVAVLHEGMYCLLTFCASPDLYADCLSDVQKMISEFRFAEAYEPEKPQKVLADIAAPEGMKIASTDLVPYRFFIPEKWEVDFSTANSAAYYSDNDRSNVTVTAYVPDRGMSLDEYYEYCWEQYGGTLKNLTLVSRVTEDRTMGQRPAQVWEFTGELGGRTYRYRQTVIVYNGLFHSAFYTLTYTALEENYDTHLPDVDRMVDAFAFR